MTQQHTSPAQAVKAPAASSTAVAGPLTLRDLVVLGAVVIIFIASVVPMISTLTGNLNLWNIAGLFYLGIGVVLPLVVGCLFLARRFSPEAKVRIGSLSVDQFASVVASLSAFFFLVGTVSSFSVAYVIGFLGSLVFLMVTVCATWIPVFAADFAGRAEAPAHVAARDAVPAAKRPVKPKPVVQQRNASVLAGTGAQDGSGAASQQVSGKNNQGQAAAQDGLVGQSTQNPWVAPQADAARTPAGQIFTPAKAAGPGSTTTGASVPVGQDQPVEASTAKPVQESATTPVTRVAASAASGADSTADGKQVDGKQAAAIPASSAPAATAGTAVEAADAVTPAPATVVSEVAATTLNPQVAQSAQERTPAASRESIAATVNPARAAVVAEPFWFAVDRPQNVINEKTRQFAFKLMPGAWILALEDRGNSFLVQDSRGKTGVLLDLVGIERAPDSQ